MNAAQIWDSILAKIETWIKWIYSVLYNSILIGFTVISLLNGYVKSKEVSVIIMDKLFSVKSLLLTRLKTFI